jgi:hypothetical protein
MFVVPFVPPWILLVGLASCSAGRSGASPDELTSVTEEASEGRDDGGRHGDGTWTRLVTTGAAPSERSTPAVAAIGHRIYVFGGARDDEVSGDVQIYDDLYRFDTVTRRWDLLTPAGPIPPPRVFAASVAHHRSRRMLVFGGALFGPFFSDFSAYGDLWAYDVDDNAWTELHPTNPGPPARSRPSAWIVDDKLYIFGGVTSFFQVRNDLWVYDLGTNTWTELLPQGAPGSPPPRHEAATGSPVKGGRIVLYGGESIDASFQFTVLGDTWEYAPSSGVWTDVTPGPEDNVAPPRNYGTAVTLGGRLYLQGGDTPGGPDCGIPFPQSPTDQLWRFDLRDRVWEQQFPRGAPLVRLKRTNSARVAGAMYVFAGFDFVCEDQVTPHQIWNHDVYRFTP